MTDKDDYMRHWRGNRATVERAIEVARLGPATDIDDLQSLLHAEGCKDVNLATGGMLIRSQLNRLIATRRAALNS